MFALLSLALLATAIPTNNVKRQALDFSDVLEIADIPEPVIAPVDVASEVVNVSAEAAQAAVTAPLIVKRGVNDPCAPQPAGAAPVTFPDTPADFLANPYYHGIAQNATTPAGYTRNFVDQNATVSQLAYAGLFTLDSYDPNACAQICNTNYGCIAFDITFERDPTLNPAAECPNPASLVSIRCILWGFPTTIETVTNTGQTRTQFEVVVAGSNGYSKTQTQALQPVTNYTQPIALPGAINAPGAAQYMGYKMFSTAFDPAICAKAIADTNAYAMRHANPPSSAKLITAFNVYILSKDNYAQGFICSMYGNPSAIDPVAQAVNTGYSTRTPPAKYTVSYSYYYVLSSAASTKQQK